MAHKVIEEMHAMLKDRQHKLTRQLHDQEHRRLAYEEGQKLLNQMTEDISHLSAVIQLAERGTFIDPPGPAKTEVNREEDEIPEAIPVVPVQRMRESSSEKD